MFFADIFKSFIEDSPVSVMYRGTLEKIFESDRLDQLFEDTATKQRVGDLAFSTYAELLSLVVTHVQPSVNAAYRAKANDIGVAVNSVYNKLAGIELCVSESLVRETALDLNEVIEEMGAMLPGPLPGYDALSRPRWR